MGAIAIGVNTRFRSAELADVLGWTAAQVLVFAPRFRRIDFVEILEGADREALAALTAIVADDDEAQAPRSVCGKRVIAASRLFERGPHAATRAEPESGCIMFTTSGTTSKPKFVLHTQRSIVQHAVDTVRAFGYDEPGSTLMAVTPFAGVSGFGLPIAAAAAAAPLVFNPAFDAHETLKQIREHGVTHAHANHEILRRWFDIARSPEDFAGLKLANCGSGIAAAMPRAQALGVRLVSIYGSSELQARFSRQRPDLAPERALEAGGFPISAEARVRTSDPATGGVLPAGEKSELEVRAPSAMTGYFGDPAATARAMTADGYLRTGDFGWAREDGSFVLEGRMGDVLKLSGFMTSPAEIEALITKHQGIAGCQVVGIATERGKKAVAFVRMRDGVHFDEPALRVLHADDGALQSASAHISHRRVSDDCRLERAESVENRAATDSQSALARRMRGKMISHAWAALLIGFAAQAAVAQERTAPESYPRSRFASSCRTHPAAPPISSLASSDRSWACPFSRRTRSQLGADDAVGARAVIDEHRLAPAAR